MSMFRQIRPGDCVRAAGMLALLCAPLSAFAAKTGGPVSATYSHAELLLDDLRSVPSYELGQKQYLLVIGAFEKVAKTNPKHPKNDHGLFVTGELYEELSDRFKNPSYRDKAVNAFRALAARFPKSPFRSKALASLRGMGIDIPTKLEAGPEPAPVKETGGNIPLPVEFRRRSGGLGAMRCCAGYGIGRRRTTRASSSNWTARLIFVTTAFKDLSDCSSILSVRGSIPRYGPPRRSRSRMAWCSVFVPVRIIAKWPGWFLTLIFRRTL